MLIIVLELERSNLDRGFLGDPGGHTRVEAISIPEIPTWADAGLIAVNGIMNGIGQYWWTRALHLAPASAVTPFFYFMLVWAILLGFVVWGDVPTLHLLLGSAVVVGSGLFLLWREAARR